MFSRDPFANARTFRPDKAFHLGENALLDVQGLLERMAESGLLVEVPSSHDIAGKVELPSDILRRKDGRPKC
jgi:hypothetical protein